VGGGYAYFYIVFYSAGRKNGAIRGMALYAIDYMGIAMEHINDS
jgi:hypothetical protein